VDLRLADPVQNAEGEHLDRGIRLLPVRAWIPRELARR